MNKMWLEIDYSQIQVSHLYRNCLHKIRDLSIVPEKDGQDLDESVCFQLLQRYYFLQYSLLDTYWMSRLLGGPATFQIFCVTPQLEQDFLQLRFLFQRVLAIYDGRPGECTWIQVSGLSALGERLVDKLKIGELSPLLKEMNFGGEIQQDVRQVKAYRYLPASFTTDKGVDKLHRILEKLFESESFSLYGYLNVSALTWGELENSVLPRVIQEFAQEVYLKIYALGRGQQEKYYKFLSWYRSK
ncbi:MAG: hypothetical protein HFE44_16980 [Oscillospiraceae bacterium]|jgi:hypothetical protein|nr:hypothetical protein [Oscillospiraceae bacterium]